MEILNKQKIDLNFGIREVSFKIAKLLNEPFGITLPEKFRLQTFPFYNGREQSIALVIGTLFSETNLVVVFGENRNSDNIFVDSFSKKSSINNNPTVSDFSDEAYKNRTYFKWNEEEQAAKWIRTTIEVYTLNK